jgi:hypothetical protein
MDNRIKGRRRMGLEGKRMAAGLVGRRLMTEW